MIAVVIYFLIWLLALVVLAGVAYSLLILPLRRQERARIFLDLLETGLAEGYSAGDRNRGDCQIP